MTDAHFMVQTSANLLLLATELFLVLAIQQLMKQMRADVDSQRTQKLPKYQLIWTLWPVHRQLFPKSRLRKCHFMLILTAFGAIVTYGGLAIARIS